MAKINFTAELQRHIKVSTRRSMPTLSLVFLRRLFGWHDGSSGDLLDDQCASRKHVNVFPDGQLVKDRRTFTGQTRASRDIFIVQTLNRRLSAGPGIDLVTRYALDIDRPGNPLAFDSAVNHLRPSDDLAAEWPRVSNHQPAIFEVRLTIPKTI